MGHVIPTKGIYEMVDACKEIPNIRLNIIGTITSEVKEEIIRRVGGLSDWIVFRGVLPHETVIKEMLYSQVFVLLSYTEEFPNVICEALSCGLPVVCSDVCDNGRYVLDGINGFLFNPLDTNSILDAFKKRCLLLRFNTNPIVWLVGKRQSRISRRKNLLTHI